MYIISVNDVDKSGRVNVSGLFGAEKVENVILAVDVGTEQIEVIPADKNPAFGIPQKIDDKNRLVLPKWLCKELGDCARICLVVDGDRRFLSPKTGSIIPSGNSHLCAD